MKRLAILSAASAAVAAASAMMLAASKAWFAPSAPDPTSRRSKGRQAERRYRSSLPVDTSYPTRQTKRRAVILKAKEFRHAAVTHKQERRWASKDWRTYLHVAA